MITCYLGIGSNIGNRKRNINKALGLLGLKEKIVSVSSLIKTKPMYYLDQSPFLNGVLCINTNKTPRQLLEFL